jgi:hypothetical protein
VVEPCGLSTTCDLEKRGVLAELLGVSAFSKCVDKNKAPDFSVGECTGVSFLGGIVIGAQNGAREVA